MGELDTAVDKDAASGVTISIRGVVDEDADFGHVFETSGVEASNAEFTVDLGEVQRINSMGVHAWIGAFLPFTRRHRVTVKRCPYPMVLQANCISNFFGDATVSSCFAPYYCPRCRNNQVVLVTIDDLDKSPAGPPAKHCSRCASALEFDELESYFFFLRTGDP